jgi:hypothetical protein
MNQLYSFHWYCGRNSHVYGLFIATPEQVASIIGKEIYFGEILGKHSEIFGTIEANEIENLNAPEEVIDWLFLNIGNTVSGYNPFDYYEKEG